MILKLSSFKGQFLSCKRMQTNNYWLLMDMTLSFIIPKQLFSLILYFSTCVIIALASMRFIDLQKI
jgi:hypothetical protein